MNTSWGIVIPMIGMVLMLAIASRIIHRTWLAPGPFFAGVWSLYSLIPIIIGPDFYVGFGALLTVLLSILAVNIGSLVAFCPIGEHDASRLVSPASLPVRLRMEPLVVLTVIGILSGLISLALTLWDIGQGIGTILAVESLVEVAAQNSVARYQEDYTPPAVARLLTAGVYFAPLAGGMLFKISKTKTQRWISALSFFPALLWSLVMTTKASLLMCLILWLASYLVTNMGGATKMHHRALKKVIVRGSVTGVFLCGVMLFTQIIRYGGQENVGYVVEVLRVAFFGYFAAFSHWLEFDFGRIGVGWSPAWGAFSFSGLYDLLGVSTRVLGIFGEESVAVGDSSTNVYTMFRSLIEDFTPVGAFIALVLTGFGAGYAFRCIGMGKMAYLPVVSLFYAVTMWSHVTMLLAYNTILLAFGLWWGALMVLQRRGSLCQEE